MTLVNKYVFSKKGNLLFYEISLAEGNPHIVSANTISK